MCGLKRFLSSQSVSQSRDTQVHVLTHFSAWGCANVVVAAMSCVDHPQFCANQHVAGYPTIKVFVSGGQEQGIPYKLPSKESDAIPTLTKHLKSNTPNKVKVCAVQVPLCTAYFSGLITYPPTYNVIPHYPEFQPQIQSFKHGSWRAPLSVSKIAAAVAQRMEGAEPLHHCLFFLEKGHK